MITQEELLAKFHFVPETGEFYRRTTGSRVGTNSSSPRHNLQYRLIEIRGKRYLAHRLAFLYMTGVVPCEIDHKDGNGLNNAWSNLRPATRNQNRANSRLSKKRLLPKGVYKVTGYADRWQAKIVINKQHVYLGSFDTQEAAHNAYLRKAAEAFGEFARSA